MTEHYRDSSHNHLSLTLGEITAMKKEIENMQFQEKKKTVDETNWHAEKLGLMIKESLNSGRYNAIELCCKDVVHELDINFGLFYEELL